MTEFLLGYIVGVGFDGDFRARYDVKAVEQPIKQGGQGVITEATGCASAHVKRVEGLKPAGIQSGFPL
jgi:hypothetical protein